MSTIRILLKSAIILLTTLVIACSVKDKDNLTTGHEPFEKSFWNRDIKYMLTKYSSQDTIHTDTTFFDKAGNITKVQIWGFNRQWKKYDRFHRVVREMEKEEFPVNLKITYDSIGNYLIKKMQLLSNMKWEGDTSESFVRKTYYVFYRFDELNRIIEEIDSYVSNTITYYLYDDQNMLVEKRVVSMFDSREAKRWNFFYRGIGIIERIEMSYRDELESVQHFDKNGLLEFTIEVPKNGHNQDTIFHSYVF